MPSIAPAIHRLRAPGLALALAVVAGTAIAATPPLPAFTAHYRLLRAGTPIGEATLSLERNDNDTWTFTTASRGTSGLASLLDAGTREKSIFRWMGDVPQGESYDYTMSTALKQKQRHVQFDWANHAVEVDDDGSFRFPTQPGTVERHTVVLALAAGLAAGHDQFTLPVAVRDRIEQQHFAVQGKQTVTVPAGTFDATRVSRTDGGEGLEAWFAPDKAPVPIKIDQRGKSSFSLELMDWKTQPPR